MGCVYCVTNIDNGKVYWKEVLNWLNAKEAVITTKDGLLYRNGRVLEAPEADNVARQHGFGYAENFVKYLKTGGF